MMIKKFSLIIMFIALAQVVGAQTGGIPEVPAIKGYKGKEGRIVKYNFFNFLTITDKSGDNKRQSTGQYWEVSYSYDSAFRQKQKFADFALSQIKKNRGTTFFQDTSAIHFVIPDSSGHLWGRFQLNNNRVYKLRLIKEEAFRNGVVMDEKQELVYDDFVKPVELPPRIGFMPNSVVVRAEQSKFHHYTFSYTVGQDAFEQKLMGPYWDFKFEIQDEKGKVDKRYSNVQIQESYYRAAMKAGGKIVKNRPREVVFNLPGEEFTVWVRVMITMDGVYFVKIVKQLPADSIPPIKKFPDRKTDSLPSQIK